MRRFELIQGTSAARDAWSPLRRDEGIGSALLALPDGRVLMFAGTGVGVLDPATDRVELAGQTALTRGSATRTFALADGRIAVVGGTLYNNIASEPEIWAPRRGTNLAFPGFEKAFERQRKALARRR